MVISEEIYPKIENPFFEKENESRKNNIKHLCRTPEEVEKNKEVFVSHMTTPSNLIRIAEYEGILINPQVMKNANDFTCSELFTHPLIEQQQTYIFKKNDEEKLEKQSNKVQEKESESTKSEKLSLIVTDTKKMYDLLKMYFPEEYNFILSCYKKLADKWSDFYKFENDKFTTFSKREFVVDDELKIIQDDVNELKKLIIQNIESVVEELILKFDDGYGELTKDMILDLILTPLENTPVAPPIFYSRGIEGSLATLIIKLDRDFLEKDEHGDNKYYEDNVGSYVISNSQYKDSKGRALLPLKYIKGIIVLDEENDCKNILKAVTRAHNRNPNFSIPVYNQEGNLLFQP